MRHQKRGRKLNRTAAHRKALMANLTVALIQHKRIKTTTAKAKELRGFAERMVTFAKKNTLAARREVYKRVRDRSAVKELFDNIGPQYEGRPGGYTRVIKLGPRHGDNADLAMIEFVGFESFDAMASADEKSE